MNNNEFSKVGLYEHNARSYRKIREAYESGERVVGIVHATGTGKTYNALQLAYDNKDKKIIYVVPSDSVSEHIESIIRDNPNLDREVDFKNVEFRTYQSFINMSRKELSEIDCDLLILDEFHHIGAPVWGSRINSIVDTHPDMKVFGMTAYTVRDRGTPYERDMANPDTDELFSGKIVSRYDLVDAMLDGVLPRDVIYRTAYTNLMGLEEELERKIKTMKSSKEELLEYKKILDIAKKRVAEAPGVAEVVRKYVKPNGKYIYFCPPRAEDGTNDINTIMKESYEWFSQFVSPENIEFYVTTSNMGVEGKHNRDMFYNDMTLDGKPASGKLRIMFAINQYNEGVHAPNIDGVIMGRGTKSDIIFFEQLGRALAVRGNVIEKYKEYESYSYDQLVALAKDKEIVVKEDMIKEDIIEKLIAPVIIDLSNNIEFIKELENNLKDRVRERREKGTGKTRERNKLRDVSFDIDIVNEDLYSVLSNLRNRIYKDWDSMYELAKKYYEKNGNLLIKRTFRTTNGYEEDENGVNLGAWINTQRYLFKKEKLSQERIDKLNKIGMVYSLRTKISKWDRMYELAKNYYEQHGNLDVPKNYEVTDEDGNVVNLYKWVRKQKEDLVLGLGHLSSIRKSKLMKIGLTLSVEAASKKQYDSDERIASWNFMYSLAVRYYKRYGNLHISKDFKTKDGYTYHSRGYCLGEWLEEEREKIISGDISKENLLRWRALEFDITAFLGSFDEMYNLASRYYAVYRHLDIPINFKTKDGFNYDENGLILGAWLAIQMNVYNQGRLSEDKIYRLNNIGMIFDNSKEAWELMYQRAFDYYQKNNNLSISPYYQTEDGCNLGAWVYHQKYLLGVNKLEEYKISKLREIGIINGFRSGLDDSDFDFMCELANKHYKYYGSLSHARLESYMTLDGINPSDDGYNLGLWILTQERLFSENKLSLEKYRKLGLVGISTVLLKKDEQLELLVKNGISWDGMYMLAKSYYKRYENLEIPDDFRTFDGCNEDVRGYELGKWRKQQLKDYLDEKLTKEQKLKLMNIGMKFTIEDVLWEHFYKMAEVYYKENLNLDVSVNFQTTMGSDSVSNGIKLGEWVAKVRELLQAGKLNEYKVEKLKKLGMNVENMEQEKFESMYEVAKKFYLEHGHLDAMYRFKHDPNISETEEEMRLQIWTGLCKMACKNGKFDKETQKRLEDIGLFLTENQAKWNNMYNLATKYYKEYGNLDVPLAFKTYDGCKYDDGGFELGKWINSQRISLKDESRIDKLNLIGMKWIVRTSVQESKSICLEYGIDYKLNMKVLKHISSMELISKINYLLSIGEPILYNGKLHGIFSMSNTNMASKYGITLEELINKFYIFGNRKRGG